VNRLQGDKAFSNIPLMLLGLALALIPVMLVLTFTMSDEAPAAAAQVTVGRFSTASCPTTAEERCYGAVVTNTSDVASGVDCRLEGAGGPPAEFFNHSTRYVSQGTLEAHSSITLLIRLEPSITASPALPLLVCEAT
jgi:hypothetical protein